MHRRLRPGVTGGTRGRTAEHGQASGLPWSLLSNQKSGNTSSAAFSVTLPIAQQTFTRTYHIVDGESIVWVDSSVTSLLGFHRPLFWASTRQSAPHFSKPGKVVVDMPVTRAKTKVVPAQANPPRQLQSFVDFTWPMAPTVDSQPTGGLSTAIDDGVAVDGFQGNEEAMKILAAEYERITLRFAVFGAFLAVLRGIYNDLYLQIGLVTLVGRQRTQS